MEKAAFLRYLASEFSCFHHIPAHDTQHKIEKRQFLNGLMKAARIFGVSLEELQAVVDSEQEKLGAKTHYSLNEQLEEPAYLRSGKAIKFDKENGFSDR